MPLARLLSKMGVLTRSQAIGAILGGRVRVGRRIVRDPGLSLDPDAAAISLDGRLCRRVAWKTLLFHKPRGVLTTRHDPRRRPTVYDVLGAAGAGLRPVGRLDQATSGLLLLTSDTAMSAWVTDPVNGVPRVYLVTVRGRLDANRLTTLTAAVAIDGELMRATAVTLRKASGRESHVTVELREGKHREVRRLFDSLGHEVTRLKRVALGGLTLGDLPPGGWRSLSPEDVTRAFPGVVLHDFSRRAGPVR